MSNKYRNPQADRAASWYDLYQVNDKDFQLYCSRVFEFFGTFFFTYGIICSGGNNYVQAITMGTSILLSFQHSGSQFNPAVTFNMMLRKRLSVIECINLSIAQTVAVILAAFTAFYVYGSTAYPVIIPSGAEVYDQLIGQAFAQEVFGTFMLLNLINIQTTTECTFTESKGLISILFMFIFFTCRIYTGNSGGVLNPALGFGLPLVGKIYEKEYTNNVTDSDSYYNDYRGFDQCWLWIVSAYVGAVLSYLFFEFLYYPSVLRVINKNNRQKVIN